MADYEPATDEDMRIATIQLGRPVRGVAGVAWRCKCGVPGVLVTYPRLPNGGPPFPTTYYLSHPGMVRECSRLEASGIMGEWTELLKTDKELARAYNLAHKSYLEDRAKLGAEIGDEVLEIANITAGGMPDRVKCLHALVGHALAKGPGVNPIGDMALEMIGDVCEHPCRTEAIDE